ncbi:hypothetical protein TNCV_3064091 [Trichonephila clavipes]|nr:hypothetical protein TNCV_3064091 [Trichonephila clavipes]
MTAIGGGLRSFEPVTRTTPEQASPLQATIPRQRKDFELDRSNVRTPGLQRHQGSNSKHAGYEFVTITARLTQPLESYENIFFIKMLRCISEYVRNRDFAKAYKWILFMIFSVT